MIVSEGIDGRAARGIATPLEQLATQVQEYGGEGAALRSIRAAHGGEDCAAFVALSREESGVDAGTVSWFDLKASPWFDALRSDPRFDALIEKAAAQKRKS